MKEPKISRLTLKRILISLFIIAQLFYYFYLFHKTKSCLRLGSKYYFKYFFRKQNYIKSQHVYDFYKPQTSIIVARQYY